MPATTRQDWRSLVSDWLNRNAAALQLDRATVRSSQPGVVTARTTCGDLIRFEVTIYPRGVQ